MRLDRIAVTTALATVLCAHGAHGQPSAQAQSIHIRTFGGFLGSLEGYIEYPASPVDTVRGGDRALASGGLIGVTDWLRQNPAPDALLLVTGNNVPTQAASDGTTSLIPPLSAMHPFWTRLAALHPTTVALGPEDFVRGLADGAAGFTAFLRDRGAGGLPFLASNVIVREHRTGLNAVKSHDFTLEIAPDVSLMPTDSMSIACARECPDTSAVQVSLEDEGPALASEPARPRQKPVLPGLKPGAAHAHLKVDLKTTPLLFGRVYRLTLRDATGEASFTFRTVRALTPRPSADPALRGLPIAPGADGSGAPSIVAFVDPALRTLIAPTLWSWKSTAQGGECAADSCELDVISPAEALKAIRRLLPGTDRHTFLAMLALPPQDVSDFLSTTADVRVVILPPETPALGRASEPTGKGESPRYSGDLGYNAFLNQGFRSAEEDATVRQIWLRGEWAAETLQDVTFTLTTAASGVSLMPGKNQVAFIPGQPLHYSSSLVNGKATIQYFVRDGGTDIKLGGAYPLYANAFADGTPVGQLWGDEGLMTQFLLDVARMTTGSDLAVLNQDDLDEDMIEWLADELNGSTNGLPWMSRFFLERILFRHEAVVKTSVAGSALSGFVDKVLALAKQKGFDVCVAGLAAPCPMTKVDADHLRLNEREIDPSHFYSIALPQDIALALALKQHIGAPTDLLQQVDARFAQAAATVEGCIGLTLEAVADCTPTASRYLRVVAPLRQTARSAADLSAEFFEKRRAAITRWYAAVQPISVSGLNRAVTGPPDQSFNSVPVEGRDVQNERDLTVSAAADLAMDQVRYALRATFKADFVSKRLDSVVSYPTDEWTAGFRGDLKVDRWVVHRLFLGVFRQSWFRDHQEKKIVASRDLQNVITSDGLVLAKVTETGPAVTPMSLPPLFTYVQGGIDFEPTPGDSWIRLKSLSGTFDAGRIERDRDGLKVGQTASTLQELLENGAQKLVNAEFVRDPAGFRANPVFEYQYRSRNQTRAVMKGSVASNAPALWGDDKGQYSADFEFRHYFGDRPPLTTRSSFEIKTKFSQPIVGRLAIGPFFNWYTVSAGLPKPFRQRELGIEILTPAFGARGLGRVLR